VDPIGWFIATTHQMLGHDKAAAVMGVSAGDKRQCLLCQYEAHPSEDAHRAVADAIGRSAP